MSARAIEDQGSVTGETFVQNAVHANAHMLASSPRGLAIHSAMSRLDSIQKPATDQLCEAEASLIPVMRSDAADVIRVLRQLEAIAKRPSRRVAFKAKGRILFWDLADILAVQAEGNYVSLRHQTDSHLVREPLSSMAEKLKHFGFIRIHRSVLVNVSAVDAIHPLPTGEYSLRLKGGMEYLVTRTYKHNLRNLAQLWVGSGWIGS
jgi:DNA-binding LytR/AlgR family response regulator